MTNTNVRPEPPQAKRVTEAAAQLATLLEQRETQRADRSAASHRYDVANRRIDEINAQIAVAEKALAAAAGIAVAETEPSDA